MSVLLDTNILIDYIQRVPTAVAWLRALSSAPSISVISVLELYAGARTQKEEKEIALICAPIRRLPVTEEIARSAGAFLRHFGKSHGIDVPDAIIAATADRHGVTLATHNLKHYPMFPKLKRPY